MHVQREHVNPEVFVVDTFVIAADGSIERIYTKVKSATMADDLLKDLGLD